MQTLALHHVHNDKTFSRQGGNNYTSASLIGGFFTNIPLHTLPKCQRFTNQNHIQYWIYIGGFLEINEECMYDSSWDWIGNFWVVTWWLLKLFNSTTITFKASYIQWLNTWMSKPCKQTSPPSPYHTTPTNKAVFFLANNKKLGKNT